MVWMLFENKDRTATTRCVTPRNDMCGPPRWGSTLPMPPLHVLDTLCLHSGQVARLSTAVGNGLHPLLRKQRCFVAALYITMRLLIAPLVRDIGKPRQPQPAPALRRNFCLESRGLQERERAALLYASPGRPQGPCTPPPCQPELTRPNPQRPVLGSADTAHLRSQCQGQSARTVLSPPGR